MNFDFGTQYKERLVVCDVLHQLVRCQEVYFNRWYRPEQIANIDPASMVRICVYTNSDHTGWINVRYLLSSKPAVKVYFLAMY